MHHVSVCGKFRAEVGEAENVVQSDIFAEYLRAVFLLELYFVELNYFIRFSAGEHLIFWGVIK